MGVTCPSCRASVRQDAEWCSLCFAVLRAPAVPAVPVEPAVPVQGGPAAAAAPAVPVVPEIPLQALAARAAVPAPVPVASAGEEPTWPCTSCGAGNPFSAQQCRVCGSGFLAAASTLPTLVLPVVGDVAAMSRGHRLLAAVGVLGLVLVPLALLTFLLTGSPPDKASSPAGTVVVTAP